MKFYSTPRDETFYGGPGVDTVYFSGKGQDYTVTVYSKSEQDVRDYLAFEKAGDAGLAGCQAAEHEGAVGNRLVAGDAGGAGQVRRPAGDGGFGGCPMCPGNGRHWKNPLQ